MKIRINLTNIINKNILKIFCPPPLNIVPDLTFNVIKWWRPFQWIKSINTLNGWREHFYFSVFFMNNKITLNIWWISFHFETLPGIKKSRKLYETFQTQNFLKTSWWWFELLIFNYQWIGDWKQYSISWYKGFTCSFWCLWMLLSSWFVYNSSSQQQLYHQLMSRLMFFHSKQLVQKFVIRILDHRSRRLGSLFCNEKGTMKFILPSSIYYVQFIIKICINTKDWDLASVSF